MIFSSQSLKFIFGAIVFLLIVESCNYSSIDFSRNQPPNQLADSTIYVDTLFLALELWNGDRLAFSYDGCDGISRLEGFVPYGSPFSLANYNDRFYQILGMGDLLEKSFLEDQGQSFYHTIDSLVPMLAPLEAENLLIIENKRLRNKAAECISDGFFFYKVYRVELTYIKYKQNHGLLVPNFEKRKVSEENFVDVPTTICLVLQIINIEPFPIPFDERIVTF